MWKPRPPPRAGQLPCGGSSAPVPACPHTSSPACIKVEGGRRWAGQCCHGYVHIKCCRVQVVGPHRVVLCSRRAAEVEQQELAGGGSRDLRRLLQAGAADTCDATEPMSPDPLWPHPLGGLSAVHPAHGWSHITLPGA